jgi:NADH:ubiquinone oxidoreductase subunit E
MTAISKYFDSMDIIKSENIIKVENQVDDKDAHLESLDLVQDYGGYLDWVVAKELFQLLQISGDAAAHKNELRLVM